MACRHTFVFFLFPAQFMWSKCLCCSTYWHEPESR